MEHGDDVFVFPDGSWLCREDYCDLPESCQRDDFDIIYAGTIEYNDFFGLWPDDDEGGPDEEYWSDND